MARRHTQKNPRHDRQLQVLGRHLEAARLAAGYRTPADLERAAAGMGVQISRQHIYRLEAGLVNFEIETVLNVLDVCGESMEEFFAVVGIFRDMPAEYLPYIEKLVAALKSDGPMADVARTMTDLLAAGLVPPKKTRERRPHEESRTAAAPDRSGDRQ